MPKKKAQPKQKPRPCKRCGTMTRETYCADCKVVFWSWLGNVESRLFHLEWAAREARQAGAST
jgi:hypothetical protein